MWWTNRSKFFSDVEALRLLITRESGESQASTLAFCGVGRAPGATTLAAWIACSLAQQGKSTILVDGNGTSPRLHRVFSITQRPGTAELLAGISSRQEALRPTGLQTLMLLPGGQTPKPKAWLSDESWKKLLNDLGAESQFVLIDAGKADSPSALAIAMASDHVLLVVGSGLCRREVISRNVDLLRKHRVRVLGVVLNKRRYRIPDFVYKRL